MVSSRSAPGQTSQQRASSTLGPQSITTMQRLFFAILPDDDSRRAIARAAEGLRQRGTIRGQWVDPGRYHLTLHFLGNHAGLPPDLIARAAAAAGRVSTKSFELTLDHMGGFPGRKPPGVLRCPDGPVPVQGLWSDLRHELVQSGFGGEIEAGFSPHVTLLYSEEKKLEREPITPIRWRVLQFVLMQSLIGRHDYRVLGEWRLPD